MLKCQQTVNVHLLKKYYMHIVTMHEKNLNFFCLACTNLVVCSLHIYHSTNLSKNNGLIKTFIKKTSQLEQKLNELDYYT